MDGYNLEEVRAPYGDYSSDSWRPYWHHYWHPYGHHYWHPYWHHYGPHYWRDGERIVPFGFGFSPFGLFPFIFI